MSPRSIRDTFPASVPACAPVPVPDLPATPAVVPPRTAGTRFTVTLSAHDATLLDQLARDVHRDLGRPAAKADLVRALLALAADDAALRAQLTTELQG